MSNTIICGMDAHDNSLSNRIGVNREASETKTVKNMHDGGQKLFQYLKALAQKNEEARGWKIFTMVQLKKIKDTKIKALSKFLTDDLWISSSAPLKMNTLKYY